MSDNQARRRRAGTRRTLADPLPLRLYADQRGKYEDQAERANRSLTAYLRERLDAEDQVLDVLDGMLDAIREIERRLEVIEQGASTATGGGPEAINVETLMLLRQLMLASNRKSDMDMIKGELKRHGLTPWEPTKVRPGS